MRSAMSRWFAVLSVALSTAVAAQAPTFEVSSVKRNVSGEARGDSVFQSDRYMRATYACAT
jgi:hypothetical protein